MEALQSLGIDWKLLIAQIVNFLILLFLLRKFLYGPIVNMLSDRKKKIEQGLKDSEEARKRLEQTNEETKKILSSASNESEKIIKLAKQEIEEQTQKKIQETQDKAKEIMESSRKQALLEQEKIVERAKKEITDIAILISEKVMESKVDNDSVAKAIDKIK